jgi:hypothetical protein
MLLGRQFSVTTIRVVRFANTHVHATQVTKVDMHCYRGIKEVIARPSKAPAITSQAEFIR